MSLEINCKLIQHLSEQTGTGKNGAWVKQDFIVETIDNYPKKVCMSAWGDMVKQIQSFTTGTSLKISFRLESREFNSRWYTDVRPWKMELISAAAVPEQPATIPSTETILPNDDLPF